MNFFSALFTFIHRGIGDKYAFFFALGVALCIVTAALIFGKTDTHTDPGNNLKLWYAAPAEKWVEALPVGNGRLGGNLRIRIAATQLTLEGKDLRFAKGKNPNPFFRIPAISAPLISPKAMLNPPAVPLTIAYDVPTTAGTDYVFVIKDK